MEMNSFSLKGYSVGRQFAAIMSKNGDIRRLFCCPRLSFRLFTHCSPESARFVIVHLLASPISADSSPPGVTFFPPPIHVQIHQVCIHRSHCLGCHRQPCTSCAGHRCVVDHQMGAGERMGSIKRKLAGRCHQGRMGAMLCPFYIGCSRLFHWFHRGTQGEHTVLLLLISFANYDCREIRPSSVSIVIILSRISLYAHL